MIQRRTLLKGLGAGGALGLFGCATSPSAAAARVVVVGGGFGGATAAKYIRLLSDHTVDVLLVEPRAEFVSTPMSNLVVGGMFELADLTSPYDGLHHHGVRRVQDSVAHVDPQKRWVSLARGGGIRYDKLVLSPGIDAMDEAIEGLAEARASGRIVPSWAAGTDTVALRRQLLAMRDGGVFAIAIPESPYRCPPSPYERASVVAAYCKMHKPRSKVLVLDANPDVTAMGALFKQAWADLYADLLEYRPHHKVVGVDADSLTARFEVQDDVRADVLNVLPPVRAGAAAVGAGLANVNARWCEVEFLSFASVLDPNIHVLGDAIQAAPMMPKSGHMANGHAKVAAAAIVAELEGYAIDPRPMMTNTCYSFVSATDVIHSAAVYEYAEAARTFKPVVGAGGTSAARSAPEAGFALAWAHNIWSDMLG